GVLEPAAQLIGDKRLLVVADGALNYIPFEALVTSPGVSDFAAAPYLIKTNEIVYAPSASVIAAIRQQTARPSGRAVLILADPIFNSSDKRAKDVPLTARPVADTRGLGLQSAVNDVAGQDAGTTTAAATTTMQ